MNSEEIGPAKWIYDIGHILIINQDVAFELAEIKTVTNGKKITYIKSLTTVQSKISKTIIMKQWKKLQNQ